MSNVSGNNSGNSDCTEKQGWGQVGYKKRPSGESSCGPLPFIPAQGVAWAHWVFSSCYHSWFKGLARLQVRFLMPLLLCVYKKNAVQTMLKAFGQTRLEPDSATTVLKETVSSTRVIVPFQVAIELIKAKVAKCPRNIQSVFPRAVEQWSVFSHGRFI